MTSYASSPPCTGASEETEYSLFCRALLQKRPIIYVNNVCEFSSQYGMHCTLRYRTSNFISIYELLCKEMRAVLAKLQKCLHNIVCPALRFHVLPVYFHFIFPVFAPQRNSRGFPRKYRLFCRALLQKRPIILRSLLYMYRYIQSVSIHIECVTLDMYRISSFFIGLFYKRDLSFQGAY